MSTGYFMFLTAVGIICLLPFAFLEMHFLNYNQPIITFAFMFLIYLHSDGVSIDGWLDLFGWAAGCLAICPMVVGEMAIDFIRGEI